MSEVVHASPVKVIVCVVHSMYRLRISDRFAGTLVVNVTGLCGCDCESNTVGFCIWYKCSTELHSSLCHFPYACMQYMVRHWCSK